MTWFFIALINPIAHAFVNHLDKYIISRFVKRGSVGALILFSSLFAVAVLPILFFYDSNIASSVSFGNAFILACNGAVLVLAIICYLYALMSDEASYVAPLFQLIPVFGFFLGFFILGEKLLANQLFSALLIVVGGFILSFRITQGRFKLSKRPVLLMITSSFFYAINGVIFKSVAVSEGFAHSLFWDMTGKFIFGILLFFVVTSYRKDFLSMIKTNAVPVLSWNVLGEILALVGEIALVFAVLFAPVALVQSVGGLQPLFVLIFGIVITLFFPKFGRESLEKITLLQKSVGVAVMVIGVFLLGM